MEPISAFSWQADLWTVEAFSRVPAWMTLGLVPSTMALFVLRLRHPRPRRRRLMRQPGAVACTVATNVFLITSLGITAAVAIRYLSVWRFSVWAMYFLPLYFHCAYGIRLPTLMGAGVTCGWATLALGGRWHPEPSWIDRAGRLVGACWVVLFLADAFFGAWTYLAHSFTVPPPAARVWWGF